MYWIDIGHRKAHAVADTNEMQRFENEFHLSMPSAMLNVFQDQDPGTCSNNDMFAHKSLMRPRLRDDRKQATHAVKLMSCHGANNLTRIR